MTVFSGFLLSFGSLFLMGCVMSAEIADLNLSSTQIPLEVTAPAVNSYINAASASSFAVSGNCGTEGQVLSFSGPASGTSLCHDHEWNATLDFSLAGEGPVALVISAAGAGGAPETLSVNFLKDTVAPSISLSSFNGGENIAAGTLNNITWSAGDLVSLAVNPIGLNYSCDGGGTWHAVSAGETNSGAYVWLAPNETSANCKVRMTARDAAGNTATAVSAAPFTINFVPPTITLTDFTGGQTLAGGSAQNITWTSTGNNLGPNPVKIETSSDGGVTWSPLVAAAADTGTYPWVVPSVDSGIYRVRLTITDLAGLTASSASSSNFSLDITAPTITAVSINNGVAVAGGNVLALAVTASDNLSGIVASRYSLSTDFSASVWMSGLPTTYTFPYSTGTVSEILYVQVKDGAGWISTAAASNSVSMTIGLPPTVEVVSPVVSNVYNTLGQTVHFSWSAQKDPSSTNALNATGAMIYYSLNSGQTLIPWPGGGGSGLSPNTANGGCVLDAGANGCVDLSLPADLVNQNFSLIINVTDASSNSAAAISLVQNAVGLALIAGKNASLLGQNALAYTLTSTSGVARDSLNGDLYIGSGCQILVLQTSTGQVKNFAGDPTNCTHAGSGGPLSGARFRIGNRAGGQGYTSALVMDSQRNLYWGSAAGIWKYDRGSGTAALFVATPTSGSSTVSGTDRLSINCQAIDTGGCSMVYSLAVGLHDNLYFTVLTQWQPSALRYFKVENDGKVTILAGLRADPIPAPTAGASALSVGFGWYSVFPDAASGKDRVFAIGLGGVNCTAALGNCPLSNIWEILDDGTVALARSVTPSTTFMSHYIPSRNAFGYLNATGKLTLFNPADGTAPLINITLSGSDRTVQDLVDDGSRGLYYLTQQGNNIYYLDPANTSSRYGGGLAYTGDGGPATLAQLRAPQEVVATSGGDIYIGDLGNNRTRKVSGGTISLAANIWAALSTGVYGTNYLADISGSLGQGRAFWDLGNMAGGKQFFKSTNPANYVCAASTSADAVNNLSSDDGSAQFNIGRVAVEGTDRYVFLGETLANGHVRQHVKKILADNSLVTIATGADHVARNFILTNGAALGADVPWTSGPVHVVGGVIFLEDYYKHYFAGNAGSPANTWVQQAVLPTYFFAVSPTQVTYYFNGTDLYKLVYNPVGSSVPVLVKSFGGILSAPQVQSYHAVQANTLLITDGNQVFSYTNVSEIQ
jgi:hypothetical protein